MKRYIILLVLCLTACGGAPRVEQPTQPPAPPNTVVPSISPTLTNTPEPTITPKPTSTPRPTNTPRPPTPTPEPITLVGEGKSVTDKVTLRDGVVRLTFRHSGRRNFIVKMYHENGDSEIVANAIGDYEGQSAVVGGAPVYFEVNADGRWSIISDIIYRDDTIANGIEGTGDVVSDAFTPLKIGPVPYIIKHDGKRNFIARVICAGGDDLVANEIGATEGTVVARFEKGPCFWQIQADGNWSLRPK